MLNLRGVYLADRSSGSNATTCNIADIAFDVTSRTSFIVGNLGATLSTSRAPAQDNVMERSSPLAQKGACLTGGEHAQPIFVGVEDEWDEELTFTALRPFQASMAMADFRLRRVPGYMATPHAWLTSETTEVSRFLTRRTFKPDDLRIC